MQFYTVQALIAGCGYGKSCLKLFIYKICTWFTITYADA